MSVTAGTVQGRATNRGARSSDEARDGVARTRGDSGGIGEGPTTGERLGQEPTTAETLGGSGTGRGAPSPEEAGGSDETPIPAFVGDGAAGAQGAADVARGRVDRNGTRAAAGILTRGNGGNLPAPGFADRGALAGELTRPGVTAGQARATTPFSPAARSTQVLDDAVRTGGRIGSFGKVVGYGFQPAVGAALEFRDLPADASPGERLAALVGGAVAEADDVAVSGGVGLLTGLGVASTGAGAPAAPYAGAAAGIAAGHAYDGTALDDGIDAVVEGYVEPFVKSGVDDYALPAASRAGELAKGAWEGLRSLFR